MWTSCALDYGSFPVSSSSTSSHHKQGPKPASCILACKIYGLLTIVSVLSLSFGPTGVWSVQISLSIRTLTVSCLSKYKGKSGLACHTYTCSSCLLQFKVSVEKNFLGGLESHNSHGLGSLSLGTNISSKKGSRTNKLSNTLSYSSNLISQDLLRIPCRFELLILPRITSFLKGRKITIRNSTKHTFSNKLLRTLMISTINIYETCAMTNQSFWGHKQVIETDTKTDLMNYFICIFGIYIIFYCLWGVFTKIFRDYLD